MGPVKKDYLVTVLAARAAPATGIGLYGTLLQLAGAPPPRGQVLDGASLVPVIRGRADLGQRELFWHVPCSVGRATPSSGMRAGPTFRSRKRHGGGVSPPSALVIPSVVTYTRVSGFFLR